MYNFLYRCTNYINCIRCPAHTRPLGAPPSPASDSDTPVHLHSIPQGAGLPKVPHDTLSSRETECSGVPAYTPLGRFWAVQAGGMTANSSIKRLILRAGFRHVSPTAICAITVSIPFDLREFGEVFRIVPGWGNRGFDLQQAMGRPLKESFWRIDKSLSLQ